MFWAMSSPEQAVIQAILKTALEKALRNREGEPANYIPELASVPLERTSAADASVWLWDVKTGQPMLLLPDAADGCAIETLAFDPSGRLLAVGGIDWTAASGSDGALALWDIGDRRALVTFGMGTTSLAFHPSGKRLASASLALWLRRI